MGWNGFFTLLVVAAIGGAGGLVAAAYYLAEFLTRPLYRKPPGADPGTHQLPYQHLTFASHDGRRLMGWLIGPDIPRPPVVILHGYTDNKSSYLSHARFLYRHGYPCFLYDQRGHGESAPARISLGPLEARDLLEALRVLGAHGRGSRFAVWGISMGAATALLAAAQSTAIAGVVAESSYERLDQVVADTLRLRLGLPRLPIVRCGLALASVKCGASLHRVDVVAAVRSFGERPLLVVSGALDPRMPPEVGERLVKQARGRGRHLIVPGAAHAECWERGQPEYGDGVLELLRIARLA